MPEALPGGARLVARGARLRTAPLEALVAGAQVTGERATWPGMTWNHGE